MAFELFGFKIEGKSQETPSANVPAFTLPENDAVSYTHLTLPTILLV